MRLFIAGATATGHAAASAAVVSRLSAWPLASLAIVFALAGAIETDGARRLSTSARWLIGARSGSGSWDTNHGRIGSELGLRARPTR